MSSGRFEDTDVIPSARWKYGLGLLVWLAFAGASIAFARTGGAVEKWLGYAGLVICIPGSVAAVLQFLFPPRLVIDGDGFEVVALPPWRRKKLFWCDVDSFFVFSSPMTGDRTRYVGWRLRADLAPTGLARAWRPFGSDGELSPNWVLPAQRLAVLLNERRDRACPSPNEHEHRPERRLR